MLRLVVYAHDGVQRFPLTGEELVIGSEDGCDILLPYQGVAAHHARISRDGEGVTIEDLGESRRGVVVNGRKVREAPIQLLDEIRLGGVTLLLEDALFTREVPPAAPAPPPITAPRITAERMVRHLAVVTDWALSDAESQITLESLVDEVVADFGGGVVFLFVGEGENPAIRFAVASEGSWLARGEELVGQVEKAIARGGGETPLGQIEGRLAEEPATLYYSRFRVLERDYLLLGAFPAIEPEAFEWSPLEAFHALGNLVVIGLIHHLGRYEPIMPGQKGQSELRLAPGLIVGESRAMRQTVEQVRAAADSDVPVLFHGEAGSGRELLARTLHLSGRRRDRHFALAKCSGADDKQIEADLFGAEVPGKDRAIVREGKLYLCHGGTVYLDDADELPPRLQDRLMRFVRSGEVEPRGGVEAKSADVRLLASARAPLEALVARGAFRGDLAHHLSQFTIEVPPLRRRSEELPLLIQSFINRICHEAGKRVQGISVQAMSALVGYDFPGNLVELESIARHLVYLCPPGRPIDVNLLQEKVRLRKVRAGPDPDLRSDLDLDRLVAGTEQGAIREALRRARGNKSEAARLLGISRNGLAMKMNRYRIGG